MASIAPKIKLTEGYQKIRGASTGKRLKFLIKDSALYGGASVLNKLLAFFTVPFVTRTLSVSEYGALDALGVIGSLFVAFIVMGQDSAVARFFYETEDLSERKQIISQALIAETFLCGIVAFGLLSTTNHMIERMVGVQGYGNEFRIIVITYPFLMLFLFCRNLSKWVFARTQFIVLSLGSAVLSTASTLILVVVLDFGVAGMFYAQLLGIGVFSIVGAFFFRDYFVWPKDFSYGWKMLGFGWPYMLVAVLGAAIPALDRGFITRFLGIEMMGFYAIGYKLAFLVSLPIMAFQTAWGPFSLSIYKESNAVQTFDKVLFYYVVLISLLGFCLVAVSEPMIVLLASSRYLEGGGVVLPLVFALILESVTGLMGMGIGLSKKTYYSALSYVAGLLVSGLAIFVLIKTYQIAGVAYGMLIGRAAQGICYVWFAYKIYPLRFSWKKPFAVLLSTFILAISLRSVPLTMPFFYVVLRLVLLGMLVSVIWYMAFSSEERNLILRKGKALVTTKLNVDNT